MEQRVFRSLVRRETRSTANALEANGTFSERLSPVDCGLDSLQLPLKQHCYSKMMNPFGRRRFTFSLLLSNRLQVPGQAELLHMIRFFRLFVPLWAVLMRTREAILLFRFIIAVANGELLPLRSHESEWHFSGRTKRSGCAARNTRENISTFAE